MSGHSPRAAVAPEVERTPRKMSARNDDPRALPTLFRIGFAEMVAYRAEMLVRVWPPPCR